MQLCIWWSTVRTNELKFAKLLSTNTHQSSVATGPWLDHNHLWTNNSQFLSYSTVFWAKIIHCSERYQQEVTAEFHRNSISWMVSRSQGAAFRLPRGSQSATDLIPSLPDEPVCFPVCPWQCRSKIRAQPKLQWSQILLSGVLPIGDW